MSRPEAAAVRWRQIIQQQQTSGLGVAEFCRRSSLAASSFFAWRKRLGVARAAALQASFVPILATGKEPAALAAPPGRARSEDEAAGGGAMDAGRIHIICRGGGGRRLSVGRGFDPQALLLSLTLLESEPCGREWPEQEPA